MEEKVGQFFGTLLGTYDGVPAFSNGDDHYYSGKKNFEIIGGREVFTGITWQCVEYARRYLIMKRSVTLPSVPCAYNFWDVTYVEHLPPVASDAPPLQGESPGSVAARMAPPVFLPLVRIPNGAKNPPRVGEIVIWNETEDLGNGRGCPYGHIAIITEVLLEKGIVRVAEQNRGNEALWEGDYASEIFLMGDTDSGYILKDPDDHENIAGWMYVADTHIQKPHLTLAAQMDRVEVPHEASYDLWLDPCEPADVVFKEDYLETTFVQRKPTDIIGYYVVTDAMADHLRVQTEELHNIAMAATDYVIKSDDLMDLLNVPRPLWEKIRRSWARQDLTITGRFDIGFDGDRFSMFEYNADSSGVMYECSVLQEKWCKANHVSIGVSGGADMHRRLVEAWQRTGITDVVHFMIDDEKEEMYTALYMQRAATEAGIRSKICVLFDSFRWGGQRGEDIVDSEGTLVRYVWKLWAWETCLTRWQRENPDVSPDRTTTSPRLQDILLSDNVIVFEPLWKIVTSNKALLPVMYKLYPNHPSLLVAEFFLTPELSARKYVKKPIDGRCGSNVVLVDENETIEKSEGKFGDKKNIFQEGFTIPEIHGHYPVLGSWIIGGKYAGFGVREDTKLITDTNSPFAGVRIVGQ